MDVSGLVQHNNSEGGRISSVLLQKLFCFFRMSTGICQHICILADLSSVGDREVGMLFLLLSTLLPGLLLQHMLHASVCFTSCNRSDPSVLATGKWRIRTEYGNATAQQQLREGVRQVLLVRKDKIANCLNQPKNGKIAKVTHMQNITLIGHTKKRFYH